MSILGGSLIGFGAYLIDTLSGLDTNPLACILFEIVFGTTGSIIDSFLGATLQVTFFDEEKKVISSNSTREGNVKWIAGMDRISNTQVNLVSVMITSALGFYFGPSFFR